MDNIKSLKESFSDVKLFEQALTHRSWLNEHPNQRSSNERFEFLGDAVLEFIVSQELFDKFPQKEEGYLTALRANLVNTKNLFEVAKKLDLGKYIFLSKGEEEGGGRSNISLLADCVEAIIGALYLDGGTSKASEFILENIVSKVPEKIKEPLKDPKSLLQEKIQAKGLPTPKYKVTQESGPDHNKSFVIEVMVNGQVLGTGKGKSKNQAEQSAAENALTSL